MGALVALAACGDDGPKAMSEDDFLDELSSLCTSAQRSFSRIDPPEDVADYERAAEETLEVLEEAKGDLAALTPPEDFARDFAAFRRIVDDEIEQFTALRDAAADEDGAEVDDVVAEITQLYEEQGEIAADLDSDDCIPDGQGEPDDPSVTTTTDATAATVSGETTIAPASTGVVTLPTIPPTLTTVPAAATTAAPPVITTSPPVATTAPPVTGGSIEAESVTGNFAAPAGYTMNDTSSDIVTNVINGFTSDPALASSLDVVGVADLVESSGITVARIFIAFTLDDVTEMPPAWSEYFCGNLGAPVDTAGGFSGETCSLDDGEGGTNNFFTLRGGQAGFAVLSVDPNLDLGLIVDAFFEANPGE